MDTETDTPELLPTEHVETPDPQEVPETVTTASAFGGQPPITKDPEEMVEKRKRGELPLQEEETSMVADAVELNPPT